MSKDKKEPTSSTLTDLLKSIDKQFGSGTAIYGKAVVNVEAFSTGVASIDSALGVGGIPVGRVIEIYGPESGGKTTTCLQIIKACQEHFFKNKNRNGVAAFIDAENALDKSWAAKMGVDTNKLIICQPESAEDTFEIAIKMAESGLIDLIIVDSVAALVPKEMLEGEMEDAHMGALGRVMSKGLTKLKGPCNKSSTTVIFINQIREKLGVMYGNPEVTPGGKALKFYASIRMEIKKMSPIKEKDSIYAFRTRAKVVKNKVAPPFEEGEFDICVGKQPRLVYGIDGIASLVECALEYGALCKKGNFISLGGQTVGNGMSAAIEAVRSDQKLADSIKSILYERLRGNIKEMPVSDDEDGLEDGILDGDDE